MNCTDPCESATGARITNSKVTQGKTSMVKVAAASMAGATLEWYDFTLYNAMAALVFNRLFFPSFDPMVGTILAFSTYAIGYISRPIGGVIFGRAGDEFGRKTVLLVTLLLMGISSLAIGVLPTYDSIGVATPLFLVSLVSFANPWMGKFY
ncbi:MFS transporter [Paraburkholderia sp. HD33-4]|uniref:MFS transporter n=1 Tax=Paraburkholderia sp. HD33-4 TaxID=2883242 RepID=UPI003FA3D888